MTEESNKDKNFSFIKRFDKTKIFVFMICLLISIILWFIFNINKDTKSEIKLKFKITNTPKSLIVQDNYTISIYVSGKGIELVKSHIISPNAVIEIDYSKLPIKTINKTQTKYILSKDLRIYFKKIITNNIKIDSINPDTIKFQNIDLVKSALLPIELNIKYLIDKELMMIDKKINILENRDSVLIEGNAELLKHIKKVKTKFIDLGLVNENSIYPLELEVNPEIKYSFTSINISFPIEKYSEMSDSITIELRNFPKGKVVKIFPSSVKLKYKVPISLYKQIDRNNFIAIIDYNKRKTSGIIFIDVFSKNNNITITDYYPLSVKYVVESSK